MNQELWRITKQKPVEIQIKRRKWNWIGHTLQAIEKTALDWNPQGYRRRGRPKRTWRRTIEHEIRNTGRSWNEVKGIAGDRKAWKLLMDALCSTSSKRNWYDDDDDDDEYIGKYSRGNHSPSVLSEGQIMRFICKWLFIDSLWYNSCMQFSRSGMHRFSKSLGAGVQFKCDGTRSRKGREMKRELANGVGSQYPSHYLGIWCIQHCYHWCAHLGCQ